MLFDLNVPWPVNNYQAKPNEKQLVNLKNTIATLFSLGYTHIAINFTINENVKIPTQSPQDINPIDIQWLKQEFSKFSGLKLYTRLTIVVNDPGQCQGITRLQNAFDLISIMPLNERALILCTTNLDIDMITLPMGTRMSFFLKHKTVGSAIEKGIKFEMCYGPMIAGPAAYSEALQLSSVGQLSRKNFFNNALQLIRASRSKGLIVSSGAQQPLHARNSFDILNLLKTLGLDSSRSKATVTLNPEKVLVSGRLRIRSWKQTVQIDNDNTNADVLINNDLESVKKTDTTIYKKRLNSTSSGRLLKKLKK